jgi:hypothetical protein
MSKKSSKSHEPRLSELLRVQPGSTVDLTTYDAQAAPGYPGKGKSDAPRLTRSLGAELSELQERLYAEGKGDPSHAKSVLVVMQGMDTSGKGGTVRHVLAWSILRARPARFKAPTEEERKRLPLASPTRCPARVIGISTRPLRGRVIAVEASSRTGVAGPLRPDQRVEAGSPQRARSSEVLPASAPTNSAACGSLGDPSKHWKYNPGDVDARLARLPGGLAAALTRCSTDAVHVCRPTASGTATGPWPRCSTTSSGTRPGPRHSTSRRRARVAATWDRPGRLAGVSGEVLPVEPHPDSPTSANVR